MKLTKLGDIIKLEYGKPLQQSDRKTDGRYPAFGANGAKARTDKYFYDKPSIIIGRKGSAGELTLTNGRFWPLDVTYFVTHDKNETDLLYIYHLLKTLNLPSFARGVKPGINRNDIYAIKVDLPSVEEQQQIVARLDAAFKKIDHAIELSEKNIQNAQNFFQAYLKSIYSNSPTDWSSSMLGEITSKIGSGATPKGGRSAYKDEGICLIRSLNIYDTYFKYENLAHLSDAQAEKLNNVTLEPKDVLLNITGASVARCYVTPANCLPGRVNQHVSIIRADKSRLLPEFLHYELISEKYKKMLLGIGEGKGSTRQAITKGQLQEFRVYYPAALEEQQELVSKIDLLLSKSKELGLNYKIKRTDLVALKQSLLTQAFFQGGVE